MKEGNLWNSGEGWRETSLRLPIVMEVYLLRAYLTMLLVGYTAKCQMLS
jgi:hypothetical protein